MALTRCLYCGQQVSSEPLTCPNCGRPLELQRKLLGPSGIIFLVAILVGLFMGMCSYGATP